jgi:hypothetical protein
MKRREAQPANVGSFVRTGQGSKEQGLRLRGQISRSIHSTQTRRKVPTYGHGKWTLGTVEFPGRSRYKPSRKPSASQGEQDDPRSKGPK